MTFASIVLAQAAAHTELPMPAVMYGIIAAIIFTIFGFAVFSYRDVANRHSHKTSNRAPSAHGDENGH